MRLGKSALLLTALALAACNETTGPDEAPSRVLLEIEYINYAWTPTFKGYFLDAKGDVYAYDRKGADWPFHDARSLSEEQLLEKLSLERRLVASIDSSEIAPVATRINLVNKTQLSAAKQECADACVLTYRAYNYDPATNTYEPVLLRAEGDFAQVNTSAAAQDLIEYVRTLGLFDELLGCDPE